MECYFLIFYNGQKNISDYILEKYPSLSKPYIGRYSVSFSYPGFAIFVSEKEKEEDEYDREYYDYLEETYGVPVNVKIWAQIASKGSTSECIQYRHNFFNLISIIMRELNCEGIFYIYDTPCFIKKSDCIILNTKVKRLMLNRDENYDYFKFYNFESYGLPIKYEELED